MDIAAILRGLLIALMALLFGLLLVQRFSQGLFNRPEPVERLHRPVAWLLGLVLLLQLLRVAVYFWSLFQPWPNDRPWLLAAQTHVGQVLLAQTALLLLTLWWVWLKKHLAVLILLVLVMAGMAFSGHVVSSAEDPVLSVVSVLHVVLAQLWLAGVLGFLLAALQADVLHHRWRAGLQLFSKWALPGMVLILVSGIVLGRWTVASWPGLLATTYGGVLLIKLGLIAGVLLSAWSLRRWLSKPTGSHDRARTMLHTEAGLALAVLFAACVLAATVPASHDTIVWPFEFRWAPAVAWKQDPTGTLHSLLWAAGVLITGAVLWRLFRHQRRGWAWCMLGLSGAGSLALALPAISIPAYVTTYMHSSVRLDADSVMSGQALYQQHCTNCHGPHGLGDGPVARLNKLPAANLTEPHVSWHTHGDMFWWLSHGRGAMPGFGGVLTVDERWHLINHLIALSLGHESRSITDKPAPFNPWLPSIDFRFQMDNNNFMSLSEWRGLHAVHLVIINHESELPRVRDLLQDMNGFPAQLVVVSKPEWLNGLVKGPCEAILVGDADGLIAKAWANYRRSFASPDFENQEAEVARMEFLIDRYGFVRARWRSDETPHTLSAKELQAVYDSLAAEGEIKSAAIHQHD